MVTFLGFSQAAPPVFSLVKKPVLWAWGWGDYFYGIARAKKKKLSVLTFITVLGSCWSFSGSDMLAPVGLTGSQFLCPQNGSSHNAFSRLRASDSDFLSSHPVLLPVLVTPIFPPASVSTVAFPFHILTQSVYFHTILHLIAQQLSL